jgi:hypothetical protein
MSILWILIFTGCSNPILYDPPPKEACKDYLSGKQILLEKGRFIDTTWLIKSNQFSSFSMIAVTRNSDGTRSAKVRFELMDGSKRLRVEGTIKYHVERKDDLVRMHSFTPERLLKLGKW